MSSATYKAVSTLEWKKKQRHPAAAAAKGFGAILGEAADLAGKRPEAGGSNGYLTRLTEIQVQDETHIYAQLVRPDEAKARHTQGGQRVLLPRGARSGRGVRPSGSRKVRFEAEGSSSHKPAVSPKAGRSSGGASGSSFTSTGSAADGSSPVSAQAQAHAGAASSASSPGQHALPQAPSSHAATSAHVNGQQPPQDAARPAAPGRISFQLTPTPAGPAAPAENSQVQGQPPSSTQPGALTAPAAATSQSSSNSSSGGSSSGGNPLLARFLQQPHDEPQPSLLSSASAQGEPLLRVGSSDVQHSIAARRASSVDAQGQHQVAEWQASTAAGESLVPGGGPGVSGRRVVRRTTDLVDKQLQWLRDSASGGPGVPVSAGQAAAASAVTTTNSNSGTHPTGGSGSGAVGGSSSSSIGQQQQPGLMDFTSTLGYRSHAIPEELFDRWTSAGTSVRSAPDAAGPIATASSSGATPAAAGATTASTPHPPQRPSAVQPLPGSSSSARRLAAQSRAGTRGSGSGSGSISQPGSGAASSLPGSHRRSSSLAGAASGEQQGVRHGRTTSGSLDGEVPRGAAGASSASANSSCIRPVRPTSTSSAAARKAPPTGSSQGRRTSRDEAPAQPSSSSKHAASSRSNSSSSLLGAASDVRRSQAARLAPPELALAASGQGLQSKQLAKK